LIERKAEKKGRKGKRKDAMENGSTAKDFYVPAKVARALRTHCHSCIANPRAVHFEFHGVLAFSLASSKFCCFKLSAVVSLIQAKRCW
jgi:hypothetical protein